jgi:hypothetical protein
MASAENIGRGDLYLLKRAQAAMALVSLKRGVDARLMASLRNSGYDGPAVALLPGHACAGVNC